MIRRLLPLLLLAACSAAPKPAEMPSDSAAPAGVGAAAAFACDDSVSVLALFRNDSTGKAEVAIAVNDLRYHLPQVVSASGARYEDSSASFFTKGDAAVFTRSGKQLNCRVMK